MADIMHEKMSVLCILCRSNGGAMLLGRTGKLQYIRT